MKKILKHLETELLTLLRMKLGSEDVFLPDRYGDNPTVLRGGIDGRGLSALHMIRVHKIEIRLGREILEQGTSTSVTYAVPSDLRHTKRGVRGFQ
jgi:hypothetical protein